MIFPERKFEAYLYDCDGTLADTMDPHAQSWVDIVASYGVKIEKSLIFELAGMPEHQVVRVINERYGANLNADEVAEKKQVLFYSDHLDQVQPVAPVVAHLREVSKFAKIAVVSGGKRAVVEKTLVNLGIRDLVQVLVCAEDVKVGKPAPEPFLKAAEKLNVAPQQCLVIEDADFGVQSAIAAGMEYVKIDPSLYRA